MFIQCGSWEELCSAYTGAKPPAQHWIKNPASMGPGILFSIGVGVWRKASEAFPDSNTTLDIFQSTMLAGLRIMSGNLFLDEMCIATPMTAGNTERKGTCDTRHHMLTPLSMIDLMKGNSAVGPASSSPKIRNTQKDPPVLKTLRIVNLLSVVNSLRR